MTGQRADTLAVDAQLDAQLDAQEALLEAELSVLVAEVRAQLAADAEGRASDGRSLAHESEHVLEPASCPDDASVVATLRVARRDAALAGWRQVRAVAELLVRWSKRSPLDRRNGSDERQARLAAAARSVRRTFVTADDEELAHAFVIVEAALALGVSEAAASTMVSVARALIVDRRLPATARALACGDLDYAKAAAIVSVTEAAGLNREQARLVEALVIEAAPRQTAWALREALSAALLRIAPDEAAQRAERARARRGVRLRPLEDQMSQLVATLSAEQGTVTMACINAAGERVRAEEPGLGLEAARADAMVIALTDPRRYAAIREGRPGAGTGGIAPTGQELPGGEPSEQQQPGPESPEPTLSGQQRSGGRQAEGQQPEGEQPEGEQPEGEQPEGEQPGGEQPGREQPGRVSAGRSAGTRPGVNVQVMVLIPWATVLGLRDDPAVLAGYGPITANLARDLASNGTWRCAATDAHGTILGVGRSTFTPAYGPTAG